MAGLEGKAELKNGIVTAFVQGVGAYGVDQKHNENVKVDYEASTPSYSRFIIKNPFIDVKGEHKFASSQATESLISNYLKPIMKQVDPEHRGSSVRFVAGGDANLAKLPGGDKLYVSTPPYALVVEVTDVEKLERLNRYLLDHSNERTRAIEDIKNGKVPEKPEVPALYRSAIDNQDTLEARLAALSPEQRPTVVAQLAFNAALHEEKLAEQQAQQQRGMERTA